MTCEHWNNDWVAHCYGELDPASEAELTRHLEGCAACRETLDRLAASHRLLQQVAPAVPDAPRLVVLQPTMTRHPVWAFAYGVAAALLLFVAGVLAAPSLGIGAGDGNGELTDQLARSVARQAELLQEIEETQARFDLRLDELPGPRTADPEAMQAKLSEELFYDEMSQFEYRLNHARAKDRDFLLAEIGAAELRAGFEINDTRQALRHVMLASNPSLSEQ